MLKFSGMINLSFDFEMSTSNIEVDHKGESVRSVNNTKARLPPFGVTIFRLFKVVASGQVSFITRYFLRFACSNLSSEAKMMILFDV